MLGFIGAAGCGKDTAAEYLEKQYGTSCYSSADLIKDVFKTYYSEGQTDRWKHWACYTHEGKGSPHPYLLRKDGTRATNREILERIGDGMNSVDSLVLMRGMLTLSEQSNTTCVVDTSTREPSQARFITQNKGKIILIRRTVNEEAAGEHHTARFWQNWNADFVLDNNTSLDDFYQRLDRLIRLIAAQSALSNAAS